MRVLGPEETASLLPYPDLAEEIGRVILEREAGTVTVPERTVLDIAQGGKLLVMPAADDETAVTKLVTVHPGNSAKGLPTIQGEVIVIRAQDGRREVVLEGATVTGRRTAALSLLAASRLAQHPRGPLLVIGAGVQARSHIAAFRDGLGVERVYILSRTRSRAEELARHCRESGLEATVVDELGQVPDEVKLIVTATNSETPVLFEPPATDVMVCAVGAFRSHMAELGAAVVSGSSVVVDTLSAAREEAGDLIAAERAGGWGWGRALELARVLRGESTQLAGPIVFKSVGHGMFDLAAARLARRGGAGRL